MNPREWLAVAGVLTVLFIGLPVIRMLVKMAGASPEVARKSIHVAMGLTCASFPWIFEGPLPVWILAAIATIPLAVIRSLPSLRQGIGSALHGIERPSYGEVLFAPAVAAVFSLAGEDRVLYLVPILILTIADAAGALVGTRWGKRRYGSGNGFKTVEGSIFFCLTAFLCAVLTLVLGGRVDQANGIWIALILSILAMMAEGFSDRGFDNLVIPLGSYFILDKLLTLEVPSLAGRLLVLVLVLTVVLAGSRWSTLNGGALLGGVLLGYGCAVLADWRFAFPPLAVFACHLFTTRKHRLTGQFDHRLDAVLSLTIASMPWVIAAELGWLSLSTALAGVSFGMGAQLAILDAATRQWMQRCPLTLRSAAKGFIIASVPGLVWLWQFGISLCLPMVSAWFAMWLATLLFQRIDSCYRGHVTGLWIIKGLLALAASLPALLLVP